MGNLHCESKICCKGESSQNEEIRLSSLDSQGGLFRPSLSTQSQPPLPQDSLKPVRLLPSSLPCPTLELKVLSSNSLPNSAVLRITDSGYEESQRGVRDGATYFGWRKGKSSNPEDVNDVDMNGAEQETLEKHCGRHFEIVYRTEKRSFWVRDLGIGFGAFLRLDEPYRLKDSTLLNIGESFVVVNFETATEGRLKLKLFGGPCKGEVFFFQADDYDGSHIHIGRAPNCEVHIDDNLISKCHSNISYNDGWFVSDGDPEKLRNSTNGTWLYLNESCELREGMVFKANQTLFEAHFV